MKAQKFGICALAFLAMAPFLMMGQGCKGKLPSSSAMAVPTALVAATPTPAFCAFLLQNCESLDQGNGSFTVNGTGVAVSISPYNYTQGTHSLKVNLSTGGSNNLINFKGFYPNRWANVSAIVMDVTADAALVTGSTNQFELVGQSYANSKWWSPLTAYVNVVGGSQSITFALNLGLGNILPTDVIDNLVLVWNTNGAGTGNFYIDNIRLLSPSNQCIPDPPTTCGVVSGFETAYDNGTVASIASNISLSYSPLHATQGADALQVALNTGGSANLFKWSGFFPNKWSDATSIMVDVYVDPSVIGTGFNQLYWVVEGTGTSWSIITSTQDVVAGAQTLTFPIDWALGTFNPTTGTVTGLYLVWNTGGTGTGTITVDNFRLLNSATCNP